MQQITGRFELQYERVITTDGAFTPDTPITNATGAEALTGNKGASFDSANSPDARTSATTDGQTRPKNTAAFVYMWAQSYVA
jgi:hypothetical protein